MKEVTKSEICFFICTHNTRSHILKGFLFHYKRAGMPYPLFVFTNDKNLGNEENIFFIQDEFPEVGITQNNAPSWGARVTESIKKLIGFGYTKAVFSPDDGWILNESVDFGRLDRIIKNFERIKADSFRLSEEIRKTHGFSEVEQDFQMIEKKYISHYLTHQTSIWKLESLLKVTLSNDCSSMNEAIGSQRCIANNYNMFQCSGTPVLEALGIHRVEGYHADWSKKSIQLGFSPIILNS